jgi:hypothetical protein
VLLVAIWISRIAGVAIREPVFELACELPLGLTSIERRSNMRSDFDDQGE